MSIKMTQKLGHRICVYNTRDMKVRKSNSVERMGCVLGSVDDELN